jgi:hypothetical protein
VAQKKKTSKKQKKASAAKAVTAPGAAQENDPQDATNLVGGALPIGQIGQLNPIISQTPVISQNPVITQNPVIGGGPGPIIIRNPIISIPIRFFLLPTISSLAPTGVVVGGAGLTLTVLGSNFVSASTVQWNQQARATTFVSATQLTAAIPASDIAVAGTASITVSNPGTGVVLPTGAPPAPVISNSVQFVIIPDISAIIAQLQTITAIPAALMTELQTYITIEQTQVDTLNAQVSTDQTNAANLNNQISNLQTQVAQQTTEINTLTAQLQASGAQTASPFDVANSFKSVVDQIQQAAQAAGGVQTTVSNMNVQLKSLVSVQAATATTPASASLIFPNPTALPDPQHLSTLSFSFGSIPHLSNPAATPVAPTPNATNVAVAAPVSSPGTVNVGDVQSAASSPVASTPVSAVAPRIEAAEAVAAVTAPKAKQVKTAAAKATKESSKPATGEQDPASDK